MNRRLTNKFKRMSWMQKACEYDILLCVLYDYAGGVGNSRHLYADAYAKDKLEAYFESKLPGTPGYGPKDKYLKHAQLYAIVRAAFELGYIKEAMEAKAALDRIEPW